MHEIYGDGWHYVRTVVNSLCYANKDSIIKATYNAKRLYSNKNNSIKMYK